MPEAREECGNYVEPDLTLISLLKPADLQLRNIGLK